MDVIFLVSGETGDYSDHQDWRVRAFVSRELAEQFCEQVNSWLVLNKVHRTKTHDDDRLGYKEREALKCPFDNAFSCDYTGTSYFIEEVPYDHLAALVNEP